MMLMRRSEPGNELAELLWENGPALRRTAAPPFFPPFACSAAGTSRAQELVKHPASTTAMMRDLLLPVQDDDDDDAVPWLHYPIIDGDDDCDTAPLPREYCPSLLSAGYADLPAPAPSTVASTDAGAPSTSHGAVVVPPQEPAVPKQPPRPSGEGVMNFTFFSRPLQRPAPAGERVTASNPVESTVVQAAAANRLRSTPLFSEQRMAWLQPPKESSTTAAAPPPPAPLVPIRQAETAAALTHRLQPEATRAPEPPPATTSSVCSVNGDRSQLKRSGHHAAEWSVSQEDEDLDDEAGPGALRGSAARSAKRGRTAEVHNMSERRRRDRINEKMRALQELIPNCNKIDKASMLEEAIEYLKTLQLQVQMMSMGTGLCVPPMLLPAAAMQHLQIPPMAHFHHHHLGAMGLAGFGMVAGAFDPRVVAVEQFPCPIIPGAPPMFGLPAAGHAMPSPAAGAHMASVIINNAAAAQAEQTMPSSDPPPRAT